MEFFGFISIDDWEKIYHVQIKDPVYKLKHKSTLLAWNRISCNTLGATGITFQWFQQLLIDIFRMSMMKSIIIHLHEYW